ncbi:hypothetical protein Q4530_14930 [Colwellia sp. 1_MG-2023]|jgi:hypothetical protein|uniref:hypothetical protein n=1 Tax=unclassified Colwellia TaxID=196834 RepID=UPI001C081B4E|nr:MULTISPECIES: hypothetical protein [unclassified Colwellia]MBU2923385.1 hypothetical protein [Colwellia sp. C2M11]MDO6653745.1 hypothetical protein [Colwellia sp. 3_MG-2023]MDO6666625.1 hypothetical protein [Colwellia sp. 2_MG-2023]MDO6691068.1 hypothetical protein [Colwellia sp. 1_MG-2023]
MSLINRYWALIFLSISLVTSSIVYADGVVVDKVYHPYVLPNEREVEWRLFSHRESNNNKLAQRLAYGQSVSENLMLEFYLVGERYSNNDFDLVSYELEARWMLTEQGEYWADWGLLFEVEKETEQKNWEVTSGIIVEKEFGRTSLTLNAFVIYEWGKTLKSELETEFRLKYRYRYIEQFQPAIELYLGEDYLGIGPAFMGLQRFNAQKQLKWEVGFITGMDSRSKGHVLRVAVEYEF